MRTLLFTFISFMAMLSMSMGQCLISEVQVSYTDCNDSDTFYATLTFEHHNTSPSFKIIGNGKNYGDFHYTDLPIKIGPLKADCKTIYEFVAIDLENNDCKAFNDGGSKCCEKDCHIKITDLEVGNCEKGQYNATFNLTSFSGKNGIDIYHNGKFIKTENKPELRIHVKGLSSSKSDNYNHLVVCAHGDTTCCDTIAIANPCICNIYNIRSQIIDCNEDDSTFSIRINFDHLMTSDSFKLGGNSNNYGHFAYSDLPITINGLKFSDSIDYEFVVFDDAQILCFNFIELGHIVDCNHPCSIESVHAITSQCDTTGQVYAYITFEEENTSVDGFTISGNGHKYGDFQYGQNSYKVGPLNADCHTIYEFEIKDKSIHGCSNFTELKEPLCCDSLCNIKDLKINEVCKEGELEYITIDFVHKNSLLDKFKLRINGTELGLYNYQDLPLKLSTNIIKTKVLNIRIADFENESCRLESKYEVKCKLNPCNFDDFIVTPLECNDENEFNVYLKFKAHATGEHGFVIKVNNHIYDTLQYKEEGYHLGPFNGDCKTYYNFVIYDVDDPTCIADYKFKDPICCEDEACKLSSPRVRISDCIHNTYSLLLNFNHSGTSKQFYYKVNGSTPLLSDYADLPLTIGQINADNLVSIVIRDKENEACFLEVTLPAIDCFSSVVDQNLSNIKIIHDNMTLKVISDESKSLSIIGILDIQGKLQLVLNPNEKITEVDIQTLLPGVYVLRIQTADHIVHKRFIKY